MNNIDIQRILPHRYPFLLVDKILQIEKGKMAVGLKNVTINEPFFQGHFPDVPIMPGVLIVEAMAQVGGVAILSGDEYNGRLAVLTGIEKMRFRKQVVPGDTLIMKAELTSFKMEIGRARVSAKVEDKIAAEGELMFAILKE